MIEHLPWLLIAATIIGLSKGGLASAGALAVPFLAMFMNPVQAAAILLPVLLVTDLVAIWLYRRDFSPPNVRILLPAVLTGILLGTFIVPYVSEPLLLAFTGAVGLWAVWRRWSRMNSDMATQPRALPGAIWGTISGVTTFITHSGAPPMQVFLMPQNLPRLMFAGTMGVTFGIANFAKIPGYYSLGFFEGLDWPVAGGLALVGLLGTVLGRWLVKAMSDRIYNRVIEGLLFILSLILLYKAATELWA
ncbi:sulfite exporter TauE/SafE family protein [Rhodobacteraceae bacterium]|nr:sulfite exporter TauE/SafE family protein [Paracoccaceae bacterium]